MLGWWTVVICVILMEVSAQCGQKCQEEQNSIGHKLQTGVLAVKKTLNNIMNIGTETKFMAVASIINLGERRKYGPSNKALLVVALFPVAEPVLPGYSLLKPSRDTPKSAVRLGNTRDRIRYSNFRKANILSAIQEAAQNIAKMKSESHRRPLIIIKIDPSKLGSRNNDGLKHLFEEESSEEYRLVEEPDTYKNIDDWDNFFDEHYNNQIEFRRKSPKSKFRDRHKSYHKYIDRDSDSSSSSSSELEKNPGNPFTIHKNKYKQNWMWKHDLDGDHMNINPYAPVINSQGPTGADLFFGRKWWYFNQDDFKPL